jgi:hypothetical protein
LEIADWKLAAGRVSSVSGRRGAADLDVLALDDAASVLHEASLRAGYRRPAGTTP